MGLLKDLMLGKGRRYFFGTCDDYTSMVTFVRDCPKMSEQDKTAFAAQKGVNYKGAPNGGNWGGNGGQGWDCAEGFGRNRSYGKGFGKKVWHEMGGNGWDSATCGTLTASICRLGPRLPDPHAEQIQRVPRCTASSL